MKNPFGALLRNRATHASTEPASSLGHSVSVPCASPARLLAKSLTDEKTRGEWERQWDAGPGYYFATVYTNAKRDLSITRSACGVSTPFTLSKAEEALVETATKEFDRRLKEEAEQAALKRLVCCKPATKKGRSK